MKKLRLITESSQQIELWESKSKTPYMIGIFASAETKNANGRIYDKSVLEREVNKFVTEKVKTKSAWGELGHPDCIFGDNEILTNKGWKRIDEISDDEIIATLNTDTNNIEYQQIDEKIEQYYEGKMYRFKNRQIDMHFTPNHRHLNVDGSGNYNYNTSEEIYNNTNTRKFDKRYIPKTGNWIGKDDDTIVLKGVKSKKHSKYHYTEDIEMDLSVFMGFLGIYLAGGCCSNTYTINIFQNDGKKADVIRDLLSKFPKEMKWEERKHDKKITFYLSDARLSNIVKKFGTCYTKYIPDEYKNYHPKYLYELVYWFGLGDGRGFDKDNTKQDLFSSSEKLIDDLSEILFKCGISTRKSKFICEADYKIGDRVIKKENRRPLYFIKLLTTKGIYFDKRFMSITEEEYKGYVYCVKVKNSNFYVRNKNSVAFWTGNSSDINLDNIAMIIESLEWKGNDVYGKAKILDTPKGNILKVLVKEGNVGVSTRGLGTVNESGRVNDDYSLITIDAVADASNPGSKFVNGILEGKTFEVPDDDISIDEARERLYKYQKELIENIIKNI